MGASTHTFLALEPRAKLQAASVKPELDMKDFIGYLVNDGKSYTLYAGNDILFIRNLFPDIGNGSLKILRNSAAEALKLHHDKNPALGGPGCFRVMVFISSLLKFQASSSKPQAPSCKLQAPSRKLQAHGPRPLHKVSSSPNQGALPR